MLHRWRSSMIILLTVLYENSRGIGKDGCRSTRTSNFKGEPWRWSWWWIRIPYTPFHGKIRYIWKYTQVAIFFIYRPCSAHGYPSFGPMRGYMKVSLSSGIIFLWASIVSISMEKCILLGLGHTLFLPSSSRYRLCFYAIQIKSYQCSIIQRWCKCQHVLIDLIIMHFWSIIVFLCILYDLLH